MINKNYLLVKIVFFRKSLVLLSFFSILPGYGGEITGSVDTSLSYGAMWRVEGRDTRKYGNDTEPTHDEVNSNDGNRNYDTGLVSNTYKITAELEANYSNLDSNIENIGVFIRGRAFYDTVVIGQATDWNHANSRFINRRFLDQTNTYPYGDGFDSEVEGLIGKDASLLDAYLYSNFNLYEKTLDVRIGQQVLNWGEGLFYREGINTINPIDAVHISLPGSEVKDLLIPQMALSFTIGLTDNVSMEAYYMLEWDESIVPPRGSYFSNNDIVSEGADKGYNKVSDGIKLIANAYNTVLAPGEDLYTDLNINTNSAQDYLVVADVGQKQSASDGGQWGVNFKYFAESLNGTEFGVYYVNYHSQIPFVQAKIPNDGRIEDFNSNENRKIRNICLDPRLGLDIDGISTCIAGLSAGHVLSNDVFVRRAFPEDIRMYGLSFNTTIGNTAIAGELAYRPNMPMWIDHLDDLGAGISLNTVSLSNQVAAGLSNVCSGNTFNISQARARNRACLGSWYNNFERVELWTGSLIFIHNFGSLIGFDSLTGLFEPHFEMISGIGGDYDRFLSNGSGPYNQHIFASDYTPAHERLDRFSWGYTIVLSGVWNDAFAGINLNPILRFKHDVDGNSRVTGSFMEDRKAATVELNANYLETISASISYSNFFGAERRNKLNDRDHIAVTIKYDF